MKTELASFTRVTTAMIGEEIAPWLLKRGNAPISKKDMALKIKELYKTMSGQDRDVNNSCMTNVVSHVRKHLEFESEKALVSIKRVGYKIGNPKEATIYATQIYKSFLVRGTRVERALPLVDKRFIPHAMDKVFEDSRALLTKFTRGSEPLLLAIENAKTGKGPDETK